MKADVSGRAQGAAQLAQPSATGHPTRLALWERPEDLVGAQPTDRPTGTAQAAQRCYDACGGHTEDATALRQFDTHAADFDDICFDQLACYKAGQWPGRTSHFQLLESNEVVGGASVVLFRLPLVGSGVANVRFGPFWRKRNTEPTPERYAAVVDGLIEEYAVKRGFMLTILPRPSVEHSEIESRVLRARGFQVRGPSAGSPRHIVDLRLPQEDQLASLRPKWRYNLRKALASGLTVDCDDSPEGHEEFSGLYANMVERKQVRLEDALDLVPAMRHQLPQRLKPRTYLAKHDGKPVAGAVVAMMGDTAYYLYGASGEEAVGLRAGYALHWTIVNELSAKGFTYYDLGGSSGAAGLLQFKKGLAGRAGLTVPMPAEHVYRASLRAAICGRAVNGLRDLKSRLVSTRNRAGLRGSQ